MQLEMSHPFHVTTPLINVPKDIILEVLKFLDPKSLSQLSQVCRFFDELLQNENIWKSVFISTYGPLTRIDTQISWKTRCKLQILNKLGFGNDISVTSSKHNKGIPQCLQTPDFFVLLLGLHNAGKTLLAHHYLRQLPLPTIPLCFSDTAVHENIQYTINDLSTLAYDRWKHYFFPALFQQCSAVVVVVDSSDRNRFQEIVSTFQTVVQLMRNHEVKILLVLANKQDLQDAATPF